MIVGVVGLFAPVSVSPELRTVDCGSAISPDLSDARAQSDVRVSPEEVVTDIDYAELCRMDLADRRVLTITVIAGGAFILIVTAAVALLSRSRGSTAAGVRED